MKNRRDREHFYRIPPPKNALCIEVSASHVAKLARSAGKISMNCDHCSLPYETYAAWAKRHARHYCSMACKVAAQTIPVERNCATCGVKFMVMTGGPETCSIKCKEGVLEANKKKISIANKLVWARKERSQFCKHGHELTVENIYLSPRGARGCKICRKITKTRWRMSQGMRPRKSISTDNLVIP